MENNVPSHLSVTAGKPHIQAVQWIPARQVLGGEAKDFTPWLAENLDILAEAIGLSDLTLIETESQVSEKRLDILATGTDEDGNERPVVIENQYGISDHRHLGQLLTYLAQQERGLAVWVVEDYGEAHVAAVEFLNRTSSPEVGYFLTRVRFTQGSGATYQVDFDVAVRPNEFVRRGRRRTPSEETRPVNLPKKQYLSDILARLRGPLEEAGFRSVSMHRRGAYIHMRLPEHLDLAQWTRFSVRATRNAIAVRLHMVGFDSREENSTALDLLRERYETSLEKRLPGGGTFDWHGGLAAAESDYAGVSLQGVGYGDDRADQATQWAIQVCRAWLEALGADPIQDLKILVDRAVVSEETAPVDFTE